MLFVHNGSVDLKELKGRCLPLGSLPVSWKEKKRKTILHSSKTVHVSIGKLLRTYMECFMEEALNWALKERQDWLSFFFSVMMITHFYYNND